MTDWLYKYVFPNDLCLTTTEYQEILKQQNVTVNYLLDDSAIEAQVVVKVQFLLYKDVSKLSGTVSNCFLFSKTFYEMNCFIKLL